MRPGWLTGGQLGLLAASAVIGLLGALELSRPRQAIAPARERVRLAATLLASGPLPQSGPQITYVFAGTAGASAQLWGIAPAAGGFEARNWSLGFEHNAIATPGTESFVATGPGSATITAWGAGLTPALVVLHDRVTAVRAQVVALPTGKTVAGGQTALPPRSAGTERILTVGKWTGGRSALFVTDRTAQGQITIIGRLGTDGTGELLFTVAVPTRRPQSTWRLVVVPRPVGRPDLLLVTRGRTPSRRTELHVLPSSHGFATWGEQIPTSLPDAQPGLRYAVGLTTSGVPILFVIDPAREVLRLISFAPRYQ